MIEQLLAIVRNTFFESIRQPIMLVVLVVGTILIIMSNLLSGFTMEDDQRMMLDMGMASIFICGVLLAAFVATNVLTREIDNKTVLTVISKPVGRPLFIFGKYLGVAAALSLATLYLSLVFALVELHGVQQTVRDPYHQPVLTFGTLAGLLGIGTAIWCNYFYGRVFASTVLCITTPLALLAYILSMMFTADFTPQSMSIGFKPDHWMAVICMHMAILVLTAIAIAVSTRLGQVMTLCVTLGVFLAGLLSDWFVGGRIKGLEAAWLARATEQGLTTSQTIERAITLTTGETMRSTPEIITTATVPLTQMAIGSETMQYGFWWVAYSILPNLQVLWLSDAITQKHVIPVSYVISVLIYGVLSIIVALALATILFQRREVG